MRRPLSLVAGTGEPLARRSQISNLDLLKDLAEVGDFLNDSSSYTLARPN